MRIRKRDCEQRPDVLPLPLGLMIFPTKKLVTREACESCDYSSHEEIPLSEAQEQHDGSPNKRMKIAMPETYVRKARAPRRTRAFRKLHSGVTTLIGSPTPPCPTTQALELELSTAAGLLVRMKNGELFQKRVGKQRPDVQPSPIGLATESRDYSPHEETPVFEAEEQHEGTSPKNLRRKKIALQETSVHNSRVPMRARTRSLKVKKCVYNLLVNRSVLSSCGEGTHSHPLPAAPPAIWMDSATSASPEPHQQHTILDWYNLHLLADTGEKASEADSGEFPMESPQVSLELRHALQETKPQSYEGELAIKTRQSAPEEETAMSKAEGQPQNVDKTMDSTSERHQPQISLEAWLQETDSQSSGVELAMENHEPASKQESAMSKAEEQPQDANKMMEPFSPDNTFRNHPLFAHTLPDGPTGQRCVDNRSALSTCEGSLSHPLPAAAPAMWVDSTTSATPAPHQQHKMTEFYKLLNQISAIRNAAKVTMETLQVSSELGNTLQETNSQSYEGQSAMATHDSVSKEETAMSKAEEQPQDVNKTMESTTSATPEPHQPQISLETCLQETDSLSSGVESAMESLESSSQQESAMSKAEEQPQDGNKTTESLSPDTTFRNHPLFAHTPPEGPTVPSVDNPSALSSCKGSLSHPLPAAAAATWVDSTTSATPAPHQQHKRTEFYKLLKKIFAIRNAAKGTMETFRVSLELGNALQETNPRSYVGQLAMETHESASKGETAISETGEQPQVANKTMESFLPNTTVCNLPLLPRTDGSTVQTCLDTRALLNPPVSRTDYGFPGTATLDLSLHRNPGGHIQLNSANSGNRMFSVASQSAELQMYAREPMLTATEYPCSVVQRAPAASVSTTSFPICPSNPLQGLALGETPKVRSERRPTIRGEQVAKRNSSEAIGNQPGPAAAPFCTTVTQCSGPGISHMQVETPKFRYGMSSFASKSAGLQMHASKPISEAAQYPCSAVQRPVAAGISPKSFPVCLPNPLQVQQDSRRRASQRPLLIRPAYEATRNQPLPAIGPFSGTGTRGSAPGVGHMPVDAANPGYGMFYFVNQSPEVRMHASEPVLQAAQYPCSVAERPLDAVVSPASFPIDLSNPLQIQQAVAAILKSGVFLDKLGAVFTTSMIPLLQGPVSGSSANPLEDGLSEPSVITEGATADARRG